MSKHDNKGLFIECVNTPILFVWFARVFRP